MLVTMNIGEEIEDTLKILTYVYLPAVPQMPTTVSSLESRRRHSTTMRKAAIGKDRRTEMIQTDGNVST
jgi:hypothetical protein